MDVWLLRLEVLLFRAPASRRSFREFSANSKEQINALNSLRVTAAVKKGQNIGPHGNAHVLV